MNEAFAGDLIAASSLLVGGLLALGLPIRRHALGLVMAFGAGILSPRGKTLLVAAAPLLVVLTSSFVF